MDTLKAILLENNQMLKHLTASAGDCCLKGNSDGHTEQPDTDTSHSSPIAIAEDKKSLFVLYMWAIYRKDTFVKAESKKSKKEVPISNFKKMMMKMGKFLNEDFSDVDQLLGNILDNKEVLDQFYDIIGIVTRRMTEKRIKREAKNKAMSRNKFYRG